MVLKFSSMTFKFAIFLFAVELRFVIAKSKTYLLDFNLKLRNGMLIFQFDMKI